MYMFSYPDFPWLGLRTTIQMGRIRHGWIPLEAGVKKTNIGRIQHQKPAVEGSKTFFGYCTSGVVN